MAPELLHLPEAVVPISDIEGDYAGPLAGLAAAMAWCAEATRAPEFLVSAAVDTPFLPADYVSRLAAAIGSDDVAMASYGGQPYPTNAIWRVARFLDLPAQVTAGNRAAQPEAAGWLGFDRHRGVAGKQRRATRSPISIRRRTWLRRKTEAQTKALIFKEDWLRELDSNQRPFD